MSARDGSREGEVIPRRRNIIQCSVNSVSNLPSLSKGSPDVHQDLDDTQQLRVLDQEFGIIADVDMHKVCTVESLRWCSSRLKCGHHTVLAPNKGPFIRYFTNEFCVTILSIK